MAKKNETPEQAEARRKRAREMKAKSRARQSKEKRDEERAKARAAMAKKRREATPEEKAAMRAKAAARIRQMRDNLSEEEREAVKAKDRARKAKKRMEKLILKNKGQPDATAAVATGAIVEPIMPASNNIAAPEVTIIPVSPRSIAEIGPPLQVTSSNNPDHHDEVDAMIGTTFEDSDEPSQHITPDMTKTEEKGISTTILAADNVAINAPPPFSSLSTIIPPKNVSREREAEEKELGAMVSAAFGVSSGDNPWWQWL